MFHSEVAVGEKNSLILSLFASLPVTSFLPDTSYTASILDVFAKLLRKTAGEELAEGKGRQNTHRNTAAL